MLSGSYGCSSVSTSSLAEGGREEGGREGGREGGVKNVEDRQDILTQT